MLTPNAPPSAAVRGLNVLSLLYVFMFSRSNHFRYQLPRIEAAGMLGKVQIIYFFRFHIVPLVVLKPSRPSLML